MNGVHRDVADRQIFIIVAVGGHVAAAVLGAHLDLQLAAFADRRDVYALIEHREVRVFFDLRGRHRTGILHVDVNRLRQIGVQLDRNLLNVEDNIRGIFDHAGNRRKFVQYSFDFYRGDGCAFNRAEQRAPQRVPYGGAPAALKRLRGKPPVLLGQRLQFGCQTLRLLKTLPHRVPSFWPPRLSATQNFLLHQRTSRAKARLYRGLSYFEYNSTINCSLNAGVCTSSRFGMATTLALNSSRFSSSHGTVFWLCATLRASITMAFWCILSLMDTSSPTFTRYDGMFTFFPFTRTCPCKMNCRACACEPEKPARRITLSRRRSSVMIRFSPVGPLMRSAFSK